MAEIVVFFNRVPPGSHSPAAVTSFGGGRRDGSYYEVFLDRGLPLTAEIVAADGMTTVPVAATDQAIGAGFFALDNPLPGVPAVTLTAVSATEVRLDWTAADDRATGWRVVLGGTARVLAADTFTASFTGLTGGTTYPWSVTPLVSDSRTATGASGSVVTPVPPPAAPAVTLTAVSATSVRAEWTPAAGTPATGWRVVLGDITRNLAASARSSTFTGLTASTAYSVSVAAAYTGGHGPAGTASVSTPADVPGLPSFTAAGRVTTTFTTFTRWLDLSWAAGTGAAVTGWKVTSVDSGWNTVAERTLPASTTSENIQISQLLDAASPAASRQLRVVPVGTAGDGPAATIRLRDLCPQLSAYSVTRSGGTYTLWCSGSWPQRGTTVVNRVNSIDLPAGITVLTAGQPSGATFGLRFVVPSSVTAGTPFRLTTYLTGANTRRSHDNRLFVVFRQIFNTDIPALTDGATHTF